MPELQISVNDKPDQDGIPLIILVITEANLIEEDDLLLPSITFTPDRAREIAQVLLDVADEAEMR